MAKWKDAGILNCRSLGLRLRASRGRPLDPVAFDAGPPRGATDAEGDWLPPSLLRSYGGTSQGQENPVCSLQHCAPPFPCPVRRHRRPSPEEEGAAVTAYGAKGRPGPGA